MFQQSSEVFFFPSFLVEKGSGKYQENLCLACYENPEPATGIMQAVFIFHMYIYKAEAAIDSPKATNCRKARNCCQFYCIFFHCHMAPLLTKPTGVIKEKRKGGVQPLKRLAR